MSPFEEMRTLGALAAGVMLGGALMYKFVTGFGTEPQEEEKEPTPKKAKKEKRKSKSAQAKTPQPAAAKDESDWVDEAEGKTTTPAVPVARAEAPAAVSEEAAGEGAKKKKKKPKKKTATEENETTSPASAPAAANPPPPAAAKAQKTAPPPQEDVSAEEEFVVVSSKKKKNKQPPAPTSAPVPAPAATQPAPTPKPQPPTAPTVIPTPTPKPTPPPTTTAPPPAPEANGTVESEEKKKKKKKKKAAAKTETAAAPAQPAPAPYVPVPSPPAPEEDEWETVVSKSTQRAKRAEANMHSRPVDSDDDPPPLPPLGIFTDENALVNEVVVKLGESVGAVMGRGGTIIRSIQESSRATCRIDKTKAEAVVVGPTECVNKALALIQAIMDQHKAQMDATRIVEIDISENIGAVMGKGGENLRRISQMSGAKIDLNKEKKSLTVTGLEDQVLIVQTEVHKALNPPPPEAKITLDNITQRTQSIIFGKGGATIRELQDRTGAKILVDKSSQSVTLSGTSAQVLAAHQAVNQLILDHNFFVVMELSQADAGLVVGPGGETIRRVTTDTEAYLDLEKDGGATVLRISGMQANVEKAKVMVDRLLTEPPPPPKLAQGEELREMDLGEAVGSVIGTQGATIIKIQENSGAHVNIIRGSTVCRIHGPKDSVASAVAEIEKIVARQKEIAEKTRRVSDFKAQQEATPASVAPEDVQAAWGEGGEWGGGDVDGW